MKTLLLTLLSSSVLLHAEMAAWTNQAGKSAQLDLQKVTSDGGVKTGHFKMANGALVQIKASDLSASDAAKLNAWVPTDNSAAAPSKYDATLDKNLLILDGKRFKKIANFAKPSKYYLFYYTASWCGPCHRFTPELVKFYNKYKPKHPEFDVILITRDSDEKEMLSYAVEAKMPWPQLEMRKAENFKSKYQHPGTGIPNLVLTDPKGKILKASYVDGQYIGPSSVLTHLEKLFTQN